MTATLRFFLREVTVSPEMPTIRTTSSVSSWIHSPLCYLSLSEMISLCVELYNQNTFQLASIWWPVGDKIKLHVVICTSCLDTIKRKIWPVMLVKVLIKSAYSSNIMVKFKEQIKCPFHEQNLRRGREGRRERVRERWVKERERERCKFPQVFIDEICLK